MDGQLLEIIIIFLAELISHEVVLRVYYNCFGFFNQSVYYYLLHKRTFVG